MQRTTTDVPVHVLQFWGKARAAEDGPVDWHPVVYHLLDVAAVADTILQVRPIALARAARLLGLESDEARRLLVALVALHDLGKFAPVFQAKSPDHWPEALTGMDPTRVVPSHHTVDGYVLWEQLLSARLAERLWTGGRHVLDVLAVSIFGHHGRPVRSADGTKRSVESIFNSAAQGAAVDCAEMIVDLLLPAPLGAPLPTSEQARVASWWVAGLVTMADWVGSNETWFEYRRPELNLADYWGHAQACAARAVLDTGITAPRPSGLKTFAELTNKPAPTPAQKWASRVKLPDGPVLVILEDVTGAGKTEAAQMLVHRLMADGRAAGAYWAMPTQATANAMYTRQADAVGALFDAVVDDARRPSVILAHGQTRLHDRFQSTVLRRPEARLEAAASPEPGLPAAAACAAFLADNRRAALLADIGAGTVDQALLGALPSRFNTVRLFGMADKVLVFDEAHAYDSYMGVEAEQLLRFQAALGGSAVMLSATLSLDQRERFATAWMEGLALGRRRVAPLFGGSSPALVKSMRYPLATVVSAAAEPVKEQAIAAAKWSRRSVPVRFVRTEQTALEHVVESARRGAAVAWVRNTVDDCLNAAVAVREATGSDPIVFHARFAQCDRQERERQVLELFGEHGQATARRGAILIGSQVIEQSLDLDFDVMVSDLAPVDLLIQRVGRLWRHPLRRSERPRGLKRELVVLSPPTDVVPGRDWLSAVLPRTGYVYGNLGVLWRSAEALREAGAIVTPKGLRPLVEAVYGSNETPDALLTATQAAEGKDLGDASAAHQATLNLSSGYTGDTTGWVDDIRPLTRLGDEQTTVRLAKLRPDGTLTPWATVDGPAWKAWALSEVGLRESKVPFGSVAAPEHAAAVEAVRADWGKFEQEISVLPLVERAGGSGVWEGELLRPRDGSVIRLTYSKERGVESG